MNGFRIRARSLRVLLALCVSIPFVAYAAGQAAPDVRALWVALDSSLLKVSPTDGSVAVQINNLPTPQAFAVEPDTNTAWLYSNRILLGFDYQGNQLLNVSLPRSFNSGTPAGMVVDNNGGNIWLPIQKNLYQLDMAGNIKNEIALGATAVGLSLDTAQSQVWVAEQGKIEIFAANGSKVSSITLSKNATALAIAYDGDLKQAWLLVNQGIQRYTAAGSQTLSATLHGDLGAALAPDSQGGVWVIGQSTLAYLNQSGVLQFSVQPYNSQFSQILGILGLDIAVTGVTADPLNHTAWVSGHHHLRQYGTSGTLLDTIQINSEDNPGLIGGILDILTGQGIHDVGLYVDTVPPTVTITAPPNISYINQNKPAITLSYSDVGSGVDSTSIAITSNGANLPVTCVANTGNSGASCTPNTALPDGGYSLSVTVKDLAGNVSQPATVSFTVLTVPPVITITSPTSTTLTQASLTIAGSVSQPGTLTINGTGVMVNTNNTFSAAYTLTAGNNTFTFVAKDLAGNQTTLTQIYDYASGTITPPDPSLINIANPVDGSAAVTGSAGAVGANDIVIVTNTRTGQTVKVTANAQGAFSTNIAAQWGDPITVVSQDPNTGAQSAPTNTQSGTLPPSPLSVAPAPVPGGMTPFSQSMAFLYTGTNPIQIGVNPSTMQPARVAVVRGTVEDTQANPLSGTVITILNHPEYGYTVSRADGTFDMAVNGGQAYTVVYTKTGYLPVQRKVQMPWRDYVWAKTVSLTQPSAQATAVTFGAAAPQFVSGATSSDVNGTRTPSLFIPAGVTATMTLPDGSQAPLTAAHLRMTEFTVGSNGQQAMPAELPQYTGYTYALDFQLDEATEQQAVQTVFSTPVYGYVSNFLKFPVGTLVPSGSYDMIGAQWTPSDNGVVIQILGVDTTGAAIVDVDGAGQPATSAELITLGMSTAELDTLAKQYQPGIILWRVPLKHFCYTDWNYQTVLIDLNALRGSAPYKLPQTPQNNCTKTGCIVGALHQTLGEQIAVTGTGQSLIYNSSSVQTAAAADRTLVIPITGGPNNDCLNNTSCYSGLVGVELDIYVAGEHITLNFPPQPNQTYTFVWDGKDGYGRPVYGSVPLHATLQYFTAIDYVYFHPLGSYYYEPPAFGAPTWSGNGMLTNEVLGNVVSIGANLGPYFLTNTVQGQGLSPGWDISSDAWYDYVAGVLHKGDGSTETADALPPQVVPLSSAATGYSAITVGPDGTTYAAQGAAVVAIAYATGTVQSFATLPSGAQTSTLRAGSDGLVYALDTANGQIDSITPAGVVTTVVTGLQSSRSFDLLPGGGFVVAECGQIMEVGTGGTQTVIAGQGCTNAATPTSGVLALDTKMDPADIVTDPGSDIYFLQASAIYRISAADGTVTAQYTYYDNPAAGIFPLSFVTKIAYLGDGELVAMGSGGIGFIDNAGTIVAELGVSSNPQPLSASGTPASNVSLNPVALALSPDGSIEIEDKSYGLIELRSTLPKQFASEFDIPSPDGSTIQAFDDLGRLQKVSNSLGGATLETYQYNTNSQLISETDAFGRTLTIDRDGSGNPTGITSPDGQTTAITVDGNGNIASVTDPAGDPWSMGYQNGFLSKFTDPRGETDQYTYDALGRLTQVQEPNGGGWTMNRTDTGPDSYNVSLTSGMGLVTQYSYNPSNGSFICDSTLGPISNVCMSSDMSITAPDGTVTNESDPSWGNVNNTASPDGTFTSSYGLSDPRFGSQVSLPQTQIIMPTGSPGATLITNIGVQRQVTLGSDGLTDVVNLTQQTFTNSSTETDVYDGNQLTWTHTDPVGLPTVTHVNNLGQPLELDLPGIAPITYSYDSAGRLTGVAQTSAGTTRNASFSYYATGSSQGFLQQVTDPIGDTFAYQYDGAGRVTLETLPDGEQIQFGYDAGGNLTSLTPPSRPSHGFDYTVEDDVEDYTPPTVTGVTNPATHYQYNLDRQLTQVTNPDGGAIALAYDTGGRLSTVTLPTGIYQYAYVPVTGQLQSIAAPSSEALNYSWAGSLDTGDTWSGPVAGSITRTYDNYFRVTSLAVDGNAIAYSYDADGQITGAGTETFTRLGPADAITSTQLLDMTSTETYDAFGAPATVNYSNAGLGSVTVTLDNTVVTNSQMLVQGTLPQGVAAVGVDGYQILVNGDGTFSGDVTLQPGDNPLTVDLYDSNNNVLYSTQEDVTLNQGSGGNQVDYVDAVTADGTVYYNDGDGSDSPVLAFTPGNSGPSQPAWLNDVQDVFLGANAVLYYFKIDQSGEPGLWEHLSTGDVEVSQGSQLNIGGVIPGDFVADVQGNVYFINDGGIYVVNADGSTTQLNLSVDLSYERLELSSSAAGVFVGDYSAEIVYKLQSDGTLTVYDTSVADSQSDPNNPNPAYFNVFAVSPNGTLCYLYSNTVHAYDTTDDDVQPNLWCDQPGVQSLQAYGLQETPDYVVFGPNGNLYVNDSGDVYQVVGSAETSVLTGSVVVSATMTITEQATGAGFSEQYTRDAVGRITEKVETIDGTATTWDYTYDQEGHLATVSQDGSVVETDGYDANGNRTTVNGQVIGAYDEQDRALTFDGDSYTYTQNGQVETDTWRNGDGTNSVQQYAYDAMGNLTDVTAPDGTLVHYVLDGQNRRVGKEVNGALVQGFLYRGQTAPVAELDGSGNVIQQYVYGSNPNVPDYIIQGSNTYRVITDQVGSVHLVVDAQSAQVVEEIDYDSWGNETNDTNPGFQPFAFAGGILDQDTFELHFGARDYDPWQGRWLQKDPILFAGGETSLYGYAGNDPVNFVDPKGTDSIMPLGAQGSSAQMAQAAEAQQAQQQAEVSELQQAGQNAECLLQQFSNEYKSNATSLQNTLGPIENLSSLDDALQEASSDAVGTTQDVISEYGGVGGAVASSASRLLTASAKIAGDFADGAFVAGVSLEAGDAIYSIYDIASGQAGGMCCP